MKRRNFLKMFGIGISAAIVPLKMLDQQSRFKFTYGGSLGHIYDPKSLQKVIWIKEGWTKNGNYYSKKIVRDINNQLRFFTKGIKFPKEFESFQSVSMGFKNGS